MKTGLNKLIGMEGECWGDKASGRIALAVPPIGIDGSVKWKITGIRPAKGSTPAWADIIAGIPVGTSTITIDDAHDMELIPKAEAVNSLHILINPAIIQPPYWRLTDCVWAACKMWQSFPTGELWAKLSFPPQPHPHSQEFAFQLRMRPDGGPIVLCDTWERLRKYDLNK